MKILVTGGAGFIGSSVVREILENTDNIIVNVDCLTYAGNLSSIPDHLSSNERYFFEQVNICDSKGIKGIFDKYQLACPFTTK